MKALFADKLGATFDTKKTVLELNGCTIEAYPSNHIDAFRSLTNPKFILIDEGDFFRKNEQEDVRHVAESYIAKSDPFIVLVGTANAPNGLFQMIEQESFDTCIYKKIFLDCIQYCLCGCSLTFKEYDDFIFYEIIFFPVLLFRILTKIFNK